MAQRLRCRPFRPGRPPTAARLLRGAPPAEQLTSVAGRPVHRALACHHTGASSIRVRTDRGPYVRRAGEIDLHFIDPAPRRPARELRPQSTARGCCEGWRSRRRGGAGGRHGRLDARAAVMPGLAAPETTRTTALQQPQLHPQALEYIGFHIRIPYATPTPLFTVFRGGNYRLLSFLRFG